MNPTIAPIAADEGEALADFLANMDYAHNPHWSTCFCRFYHLDCGKEEWLARSRETNCAETVAGVADGSVRGYLARADGRIVGWLNANDIRAYPRLREAGVELVGEQRAGCTICFVVDPAWRGRGVGRALLARAVTDFRAAGYDYALAFPFDADRPERRYRGTPNMYRELGYEEVGRQGDIQLLRLRLAQA